MYLQEAYKILNEAPATKVATRLFNRAAVAVKNSMTPEHIKQYAKEVREINNKGRETISLRDSPFMSNEFKKATLGAEDRKEFVDSVAGLNKDRKTAIGQKINKATSELKSAGTAIGGGILGASAVEGIKSLTSKKDKK